MTPNPLENAGVVGPPVPEPLENATSFRPPLQSPWKPLNGFGVAAPSVFRWLWRRGLKKCSVFQWLGGGRSKQSSVFQWCRCHSLQRFPMALEARSENCNVYHVSGRGVQTIRRFPMASVSQPPADFMGSENVVCFLWLHQVRSTFQFSLVCAREIVDHRPHVVHKRASSRLGQHRQARKSSF